jgi:hypothetical protein
VNENPFDNPDGGAWKQGWPIVLESEQFATTTEKLNVLLVVYYF